VEDGVVGHRRYANFTRSLDMPYILEILGLGSKQPMNLIVALLDKVPKSGSLRSNQCSEGNLLLLNGPKGVLNNRIVRRGWLRGRTRSSLTRVRGWMIGCGSNNVHITRYLIKVTSVKKGGAIDIGKRRKPLPKVNPTQTASLNFTKVHNLKAA